MLKKRILTKSIFEISQKFFYDFPDPDFYYQCRPKTSFHLVNWVVSHSSLEGNMRLIAAQIASHYNVKTGMIDPSIETIVWETRFNKTTVQKAVKEMESSGEWILESVQHEGFPYPHTRYIPVSPARGDSREGLAWRSSRMDSSFKGKIEQKKKSKTNQSKRLKERLAENEVSSLRELKKIE